MSARTWEPFSSELFTCCPLSLRLDLFYTKTSCLSTSFFPFILSTGIEQQKKEESLAAAPPFLFFHSASVSSFISTTGAASRFLA